MKIFYFVIVILSISSIIYAQYPTITSDYNPVPGDVWVYKNGDTNNVYPGSSGENVTWDFTTVNLNGNLISETYIIPSLTPYYWHFTSSNLAKSNSDNTKIEYLLTNDSMCGFYGDADSSFSGLELNRIIGDVYPKYQYPLTYNFQVYINQGLIYNTGGGGNWSHMFFIDSLKADGWGTIILPGGTTTITNILRVRLAMAGIDSSNTGISYIYQQVYSWFRTDKKFPVFQIIISMKYQIGVGFSGFKAVYGTEQNVQIGIHKISEYITSNYNLHQNYPNPFNSSTNIRYKLPKNGLVKLIVFDMLGREIETLVKEKQTAGTYEATFNASQYPSGVYFYRLTTDGFSETKKMILIK